MDEDIQALSPFFYTQELAEVPSAPPSLMFGFTGHYASSSSSSPSNSTAPYVQATIDIASFSSELPPHVNVADGSCYPTYLVTDVPPQQQDQQQAFDPRFVNVEEEESNVIDISFNPVQKKHAKIAQSPEPESDDGASARDDDYCETDDGEDDEDGDFDLGHSTTSKRSSSHRRTAFTLDVDPEFDDASSNLIPPPRPRGLTAPVPVPGLVKKSRGRRVPTAASVVSSGGIRKASRSYMCTAEGCGKCFARGEHLKRHVRSIHTNEKRTWYIIIVSKLVLISLGLAHKCTHPGCGKDFSRHDNLNQHMRIHKGY